MGYVSDIYIIILFLTSMVAAAVAFMAWKRRPSQGATPLVMMMISIIIWSLFQALTVMQGNFDLKLTLSNTRYFGIELAPIAFYSLAYEYFDRSRNLSVKTWVKLLVVPFICLLLLWTNPSHHLFYKKVKLAGDVLNLENGPFFWVNMIYLYIFITAAVYLFMRACLKSISIYRKQAVVIALAAFIPVTANIAFNFELLPIKNIDTTPTCFLISGILYFSALFQLKLLDVIPVARDRLIEEMDDMVIVIDNKKRILDLNKKARYLIFNSENNTGKYVGENILDYLDNWEELANFIVRSNNVNERIVFNGESGPEYYHLSISIIFDKKENECGNLIILRNITELEQALLDAKNARAAAEYANKAKGFFLANVSHEIRTPMNAVIGMAQLLESTDMPPEKQKACIRTIINSSEYLTTIINDILDFSKIEAGEIQIEKNVFDLNKLACDTVEMFKLSADNKSIGLECMIDTNMDMVLIGDSFRVRQVLTNLIGNALKFTDKGGIKIFIKPHHVEENRQFVNLTVSDTGIGIPEEKFDKIFESFKQVDSSTTRKYGGTGLGLSIVKSLVEHMGGSIRVESELGKGSSFICSIPFEIAAEHKQINLAKEECCDSIPELSQLKVLVADDNKTNREIIKLHLHKLSCQIDFAENGLIAVQRHESSEYDIIFMDVQMPEMDGLEAASRIREREKLTGKHVPVIALTAGVMAEDIDRCLKAGMDAHLPKPVKVQNLYRAIKEYVKLNV